MRIPSSLSVLRLFLILAVIAADPAVAASAGQTRGSQRPAHTYSIVARDPATGEMGVAVQSHWFSVGPLVAFGEAGVGVVATQSFIDSSYGPLGLTLMKGGRTAGQALEALKTADPHPELRQVAMLDVNGNVAVFTGAKCIRAAGHLKGENFSVQANLMLNDTVWPAMADAFRRTKGELGEKMLAALEAAQATGGDLRGKQSAAILIVKGKSSGRPWADKVMDLRVDDAPEPLKELRRLVRRQQAYDHMNRGDLAIEAGDGEKALHEYGTAEAMYPDNLEMTFWFAMSLVHMGRVEEALPLFRKIFASDRNWASLPARLVEAGLLQIDKSTLQKILSTQSPPARQSPAETIDSGDAAEERRLQLQPQ